MLWKVEASLLELHRHFGELCAVKSQSSKWRKGQNQKSEMGRWLVITQVAALGFGWELKPSVALTWVVLFGNR